MTAKKPAPDRDPVLALLRLKRHEVPTPDYFERFIDEFHRRQSAQLLRRPIWRIALDRIAGRLIDPVRGPIPARRLIGAAALVLVAAAAVSGVLLKPWEPGAGERIAEGLFQSSPASAAGSQGVLAERNRLSLDPNLDRIFLEEALRERQGTATATTAAMEANYQPDSGSARRAVSTPRYVIDARPVSHESPVLSF